MNIEDLTKTQLLLLTILVNFVTSIATGVLTVSLLDQAPPTVIQTVNRIVDHTIEQVTTEVPVIRNVPVEGPSTEDLLTAAIAEHSARTVRIYRVGASEPSAYGVFMPGTRSVFTTSDLPGTVRVEIGSSSYEVQDQATEGEVRRYAFAADAIVPQAPSAEILLSSQLKQGQTTIALSAAGDVITGIVTRLDEYVHTDAPAIPRGGAVVNISGDIIGISLGDGRIVSGDVLRALVAQ